MKIQYLNSDMIDRKRWDETISLSFNGIVYGYSWFLDLMADNWGALMDENYTYLFPFAWRKKWGVKYVYQPIFTILSARSKSYLHFIQKFERYERRHSRINAYNPSCISAKEGDVVKIAECRPLSKTKAFVVIEKVK